MISSWADDLPGALGLANNNTYNPPTWADFDGSPCAVQVNGLLNIFARLQNSLVLYFFGPGGSGANAPQDWTAATGTTSVASDPCVVLNGNLLYVFAIDPNGNLILFVGSQSTAPVVYNLSAQNAASTGLALTGTPFAISWDATHIAVAARTANNNNPVWLIVSTATLLATFVNFTYVTLGSDPILLLTTPSQLSLIGADQTQQNIIHISGSPQLPTAPGSVLFPTGILKGPLKLPDGVHLAWQGTPIIVSPPTLWNIETRSQSQSGVNSKVYQFVDPRPSVVLNSDGSIYVFLIGTTNLNNQSAQHLLRLGWNSQMASNPLTVTDMTGLAGGAPLVPSTCAIIDNNLNIHVLVVTNSGKLQDYVLTPGNLNNPVVTDRTGKFSSFGNPSWSQFPVGGVPTVIATPCAFFTPLVNFQGVAYNNVYNVVVGQYIPPQPTLAVANLADTSVTLVFIDNGTLPNYFTGFQLWRQAIGQPYTNVYTGAGAGPYQDTGLSPYTLYNYLLFTTTTGSSSQSTISNPTQVLTAR